MHQGQRGVGIVESRRQTLRGALLVSVRDWGRPENETTGETRRC